MRQECAETVPEEMPLLAGDAFHFFNQVVEVEGLKLPGFEQRGLLLHPGIEILVIEIRLRGHDGLLCAEGSLVSGVSEDSVETGDVQERGCLREHAVRLPSQTGNCRAQYLRDAVPPPQMRRGTQVVTWTR